MSPLPIKTHILIEMSQHKRNAVTHKQSYNVNMPGAPKPPVQAAAPHVNNPTHRILSAYRNRLNLRPRANNSQRVNPHNKIIASYAAKGGRRTRRRRYRK